MQAAEEPALITNVYIDTRAGIHTDAPFKADLRLSGAPAATLHGQLSTLTTANSVPSLISRRTSSAVAAAAEACAEHLWRVYFRDWPQPRILSTQKLIEMLDGSTVDSIEISSDKGMKIRISKAQQQAVMYQPIATQYRGLTVAQLTDLRAKARAQGVYMRVVKNTLARKAFAGTAFEPVGPKLKGPLLLAFSKDDPGAAARVVRAFAKDNEKLVATLVSLGGEVLPGKDLEKVATLPTRDQARAQLLGLLMAPMQQLAARLAEIPTDPRRPVLIICNTQNRSSATARALRQRGFAHVRYVQGGMSEWARRGWPLVAPGR